MKKVIAATKRLALELGLIHIANNCNRKSTTDEIYGYIVLMCNYMMSHKSCTEDHRNRIIDGLKLITVSLNIVSDTKFELPTPPETTEDDNTFIEDGEVKYIIPPPKDGYLRSVKGTNSIHDMKKPTGRKAYMKEHWQVRKRKVGV